VRVQKAITRMIAMNTNASKRTFEERQPIDYPIRRSNEFTLVNSKEFFFDCNSGAANGTSSLFTSVANYACGSHPKRFNERSRVSSCDTSFDTRARLP
jgi:hypothetical protein